MIEWGEEELSSRVGRLKSGRAAGRDWVWGETIQELAKEGLCKKVMVGGINEVVRSREVPSSWREANMKLIEKCKEPSPGDFRPITITSVGYKLFWSGVRDRMEEHLRGNGMIKDNQTGFTKGGRLEYNLFVLQYLVERTYGIRKVYYNRLVVIAIDFRKAYDSIDRGRLLEALVRYRINPGLIDLVAKVYSGDEIVIRWGDREERIRVTSGIRQGCTASTFFFKLVTYIIIEELEGRGVMFEVDGLRVNSMWFADDSILVGNSVEAAERNLRIVKEIGGYFGLKINEEKSMALVFRDKGEIKEIGGIKVVDSIKYLGVKIGSGRDIFKAHKIKIENEVEGKACRLRKVVEKSYNRLEVGKTWWKNGVVPGLLHGVGVMDLGEGLIGKLQRMEYRVYRQLLGAAGYAPLAVMRGEVGASLMRTRVMSARILLVKSIIDGDNGLVKEVLGNVRKLENYSWNKTLDRYLTEVGIGYKELEQISKGEIRKRIRDYDTWCWMRELEGLRSVGIYRESSGGWEMGLFMIIGWSQHYFLRLGQTPYY